MYSVSTVPQSKGLLPFALAEASSQAALRAGSGGLLSRLVGGLFGERLFGGPSRYEGGGGGWAGARGAVGTPVQTGSWMADGSSASGAARFDSGIGGHVSSTAYDLTFPEEESGGGPSPSPY